MAVQWIKSLFGGKSDNPDGADSRGGGRSGSGGGSGKSRGGKTNASGGGRGGGGSKGATGSRGSGGKITPVSPSRARIERRANDEKIIKTIKITFTTIIIVAVIGIILSVFLYVYKPTVATVGGAGISQYEFTYQLMMAANYASEYSTPDSIGQDAMNMAAEAKIWQTIAKGRGFSLSAEDKEEINYQMDYIDQMAASSASSTGATMTGDDYLRSYYGVNKSQFRRIMESEVLMTKLYEMEYDQINVPDEDAQLMYDANFASYEEASVRHILFFYEGPDSLYDEDYENALIRTPEESEQLAMQVVERIMAGEDMVELVHEYSEDGDLSNDGLYTFSRTESFEPGFLDWTFDPARFVGEVGICETSYGYHVMRLEDMHVIPFEDAKESIIGQIKSDEIDAISESWKNDPQYQVQINQQVYESVIEQVLGYY